MAHTTSRFEAIVVGGGPAGSTAARALALAGVRTLLLEAQPFPRYKACGGGVPVRTEALVGLPLDAVVEGDVDALHVSHLGRRGFTRRAAAPFARMVMRDRFDALLLEAAAEAGAEVRVGERVDGAQQDDAGVTVATGAGRYAAPWLLAADGATGPVARWLGARRGAATSAAYELEVSAPAWAVARWRGTANVDVGYRPWGYGWVFPKAGRLLVGVVLAPRRGAGIRRACARYVAGLGLEGAAVEVRQGHPIRFRREADEAVWAGRGLLLGDAAGLADEFTAEGIAYAVHSGRLAAEAVVAALGSDGEAGPRYAGAVDREIQPELDAARAISRMYYGCVSAWPRLALGVSGRVGYFWRAFFRVMRGESTYASELGRWPLLRLTAGRL